MCCLSSDQLWTIFKCLRSKRKQIQWFSVVFFFFISNKCTSTHIFSHTYVPVFFFLLFLHELRRIPRQQRNKRNRFCQTSLHCVCFEMNFVPIVVCVHRHKSAFIIRITVNIIPITVAFTIGMSCGAVIYITYQYHHKNSHSKHQQIKTKTKENELHSSGYFISMLPFVLLMLIEVTTSFSLKRNCASRIWIYYASSVDSIFKHKLLRLLLILPCIVCIAYDQLFHPLGSLRHCSFSQRESKQTKSIHRVKCVKFRRDK